MVPDLDFFSSVLHARSESCSLINDLIVEALAYTAGIYLCFAGAALVSPRRYAWPAWAATAISVGLWITFASYVLVRLEWIRKSAFDAVYIRGGLVLYALKTAYDTAVMRAEIEATVDKGEQADVLNLALTQMLNFLQLLIRVVTILADAKKSSKKRDD
jgi:FtsH-binding integral membrane protein